MSIWGTTGAARWLRIWLFGLSFCVVAAVGCGGRSQTGGNDAGWNQNDAGGNFNDAGGNQNDGGQQACQADAGLCGAGGSCPAGCQCYGGICLGEEPECMLPGYPFDGAADSDLEPNNLPELATALPCGDPADPSYTPCTCPPLPAGGQRRKGAGGTGTSYQNGLQGLAICPAGDRDIYSFYLFAGEVLAVLLTYRYNLGRDLNLQILKPNQQNSYDVVAQALSSNDNEDLDYTAPEDDTYYIVVLGANPEDIYDGNGNLMRPADLNEYILQFHLNPPGCNLNATCDPYETNSSCPPDCAAAPFCGNLICETGETGCSQDCFCGNGSCDVSVGENTSSCQVDCPSCP